MKHSIINLDGRISEGFHWQHPFDDTTFKNDSDQVRFQLRKKIIKDMPNLMHTFMDRNSSIDQIRDEVYKYERSLEGANLKEYRDHKKYSGYSTMRKELGGEPSESLTALWQQSIVSGTAPKKKAA